MLGTADDRLLLPPRLVLFLGVGALGHQVCVLITLPDDGQFLRVDQRKHALGDLLVSGWLHPVVLVNFLLDGVLLLLLDLLAPLEVRLLLPSFSLPEKLPSIQVFGLILISVYKFILIL